MWKITSRADIAQLALSRIPAEHKDYYMRAQKPRLSRAAAAVETRCVATSAAQDWKFLLSKRKRATAPTYEEAQLY